jgi:hypothetical protein
MRVTAARRTSTAPPSSTTESKDTPASAPAFTHSFGRPRLCPVVQLLNARLVTEMRERRREFQGVQRGEVRFAEVARRPDRGIRRLGETVDPDHDLTQQRIGPRQIHDRYHDDGEGAHRGDLIRDAAHREPSEPSPTPASEDDHVCVQFACRFQDCLGRMTITDDASEIASRSFYVFIRA